MLHCFKTILVALFFFCLHPLSYSQKKDNPKEICLTSGAFDNRYASYNLSGDKIVFESNRDGNWEVYIMDFDGKNTLRVTNNSSDDRRPSWHPNGASILFESNRSGKNELYEYSLETKGVTKIPINITDRIIFSRFSPDGKFIVFSAEEKENDMNIYRVNRDGSIIKKLVDNSYRNVYPTLSSDGNKLLFFSRKDTDNKDDEIYELDLLSNKEKRLTNWHKHNFCPSWSVDGKKIAYVTSMEDSRPEIYIMNSDGSGKERITYNKDGDTLPNWHPNEAKLLITAYRNGNYHICELKIP